MKFRDQLVSSGLVNYARETLEKKGKRAVVRSLPCPAKTRRVIFTVMMLAVEGSKNEMLIMIEEGTSIVDEQAYCISFPEEFDDSAENAEAYRRNETTAEMSSHVTYIGEPVFDMCSPEEPEIETNIIPDNSIYLMVKWYLLMTVRRKHVCDVIQF